MIVTLATPITAVYDDLGYGNFVISLPAGTQEVDARFGKFLIEKYDGVTSPDAVAKAAEESTLQEQVVELQKQIESMQETKSEEIIPPVEEEVVPAEEVVETGSTDDLVGTTVTEEPAK